MERDLKIGSKRVQRCTFPPVPHLNFSFFKGLLPAGGSLEGYQFQSCPSFTSYLKDTFLPLNTIILLMTCTMPDPDWLHYRLKAAACTEEP